MSQPPESDFDPNAPAMGDGIFGLPDEPGDARIRLLAVPFEATCSYGGGTALGPDAILAGSRQVDLHDAQFGDAWRTGIHLEQDVPLVVAWNDEARRLARRVIESGGPVNAELAAAARRVDELSAERSRFVEDWTRARLDEDRIVGVVGGDHSCPLGALRAVSGAVPLSILHVDAHLDLRDRYEGFAESHASIMHNVLDQCPGVEHIVQIGIRDFCAAETERADAAHDRVRVCRWADWSARMYEGEPFQSLVDDALSGLTSRVWISFDIDGLDPSLCPGTGTPVPGGLSFDQAAHVLVTLARSGRKVVGFDLCEVGAGDWDGNVGARVLYKLCGIAGAAHEQT